MKSLDKVTKGETIELSAEPLVTPTFKGWKEQEEWRKKDWEEIVGEENKEKQVYERKDISPSKYYH